MVNGRTVIKIKEGDGSIYLLYKQKGEIRSVLIKAAEEEV